MDLYQMSYEPIADRLKRLANSPQPQALANRSLGGLMKTQMGAKGRTHDEGGEPDRRIRGKEGLKYAKLTLETDYTANQQQQLAPTTRKLPRDYLSPNRQRNAIERPVDLKATLKREQEPQERMTAKGESENDAFECGIANVRSEGTLKIEEIMESFNSYKQNKQKYVSSLGKYSHSRTETEPTPATEQVKQSNRPFSDLLNVWSEEQDEKTPQFQRSRNSKCLLDDLAGLLNNTPELEDENRPRDPPKPRDFSKDINTTKLGVQSILSPRGTRAPGRICRNAVREGV